MTNQELFNQKMTALADAINSKTGKTGKMTIDEMTVAVNNLKVQEFIPVGGKVFYVDPADNGATYTFYDGSLNVMTPTVGSTPVWYKINGTPTKDKYYVFHETPIIGKTWTYKNGSRWVFQIISTATAIGQGKHNSQLVLAKDNGAYIKDGTIWYELNQMNINKTGMQDGWYIGSFNEVKQLATTLITDKVIVSSSDVSSAGGERVFSQQGPLHTYNSDKYSTQVYYYAFRSF